MPINSESIKFVALNDGHFQLLEDWFSSPHVKEWWPDGKETIKDIRSGAYFDEHIVTSFIAQIDELPIAYIQAWSPSVNAEYPWQADLPDDAHGIDLFIGPPNLIDKGYGSKIIGEFIKLLREDSDGTIYIDPDPKNIRAIKAFKKCGFEEIGLVNDIDGQSILMKLENKGDTNE